MIRKFFSWSSRKIKYRYLRGFVIAKKRANNMMSAKEKINETQDLSFKIVRRMIYSPNSELLLSPISGTHYIHSKDVFVRIDDMNVCIINGKYSYDVQLMKSQIDDLLFFFHTKMESKRKVMEKEIMSKTQRSLKTILADLES